jgi:MinD superfamily P-loop ATPase
MEIAIISGKGGTGKSSITAAFATLQSNCVLADCDVDAANLYLLFRPACNEEHIFISGQKAVIDPEKCVNCGLCAEYCRFDAITEKNGRTEVIETFCDGCLLCSRLCPHEAIDIIDEDKSRFYAGDFQHGRMVYGRLAPGEENSGKLVSEVRERARQIAHESGIETIIIDGPPGIGCSVISAITGVDTVIVVTEPTVTGVHDLKRTLEMTSGFQLHTRVIVNKHDINREITAQIEAYCHQNQIDVIGKYPFDKRVVEAMVNCKAVTDYAPDAEISQRIRETCSLVFG